MSAGHKKISTGSHPLLHSKLLPPRLNATVIRRDVLLARLDEGLRRKLILVSAPTGFGKTTLVVSWLAARALDAAWLTLDQNDNDPTRFWTYAVSALRTIDSSLGRETLSMLLAPQPVSFPTLLTPLINDLAHLTTPAVLVLEDFHVIQTRDILDGVNFLIQHCPEDLHLLLVTRLEPDLPLALFRVRDEMIEIDAADLRFDPEVTQAFLQKETQMELSPLEIRKILEKTEGWAAGLRLIAVSLQKNGGSANLADWIKTFSGQDRYVANYLIEEVFRAQTQQVQTFLLKTCIVPRLTASLCDALTDMNNCALILEQLERENLFLVPLERSDQQTWYRYTPIFAESIQYLARQQLGEASLRAVYEKASQWYEYHGFLEDAVETALAAGLLERAIMLIEKFIEIHDLSEMNTLARWLKRIPEQTVLLNPMICFTYAQVILYSEDRFAAATSARIEPYLRAAEDSWETVHDHEKLGKLFSFRGNVHWWQGDLQKAFQFARQSLNELPEHDIFWRGNSLLIVGYELLQAGHMREAQDCILEARALLGAVQNIFGVLAAIQMLGEIFYWQGELDQAEQLNQQILVEAVGYESMLDDQGIAALSLARVAYERNDLETAEQQAGRALELAHQRANQSLEVQATIQVALLDSARGEVSRARERLKALEATIQTPNQMREIQNMEALLAIRANDLASLGWWVKMILTENERVLDLQREREAFTLARLRIAENRLAEAIDLLTKWKDIAEADGRLRSQVEALCLESLAQYASSKSGEAARVVSQALVMAYPKGFRRTFLDEGAPMAGLLQATLSMLPSRSLHLFASTLLQSFGHEKSSAGRAADAPLLGEQLSPQEMRVLRLLVAGLSNSDIARELIVSTNTIKTHIKSIYRKLGVNSREEAREVARGLRLL